MTLRTLLVTLRRRRDQSRSALPIYPRFAKEFRQTNRFSFDIERLKIVELLFWMEALFCHNQSCLEALSYRPWRAIEFIPFVIEDRIHRSRGNFAGEIVA